MIQLFASDLDGTLLNAMHMVDGRILAAIREVTASGAHFAIATGRTLRSNHDFGFTGVDVDVVCSNGSIVLDTAGRLVHHSSIDPAFLEEMLGAFPQVCFECVGTERTYVTGTAAEREDGFKRDGLLRAIALRGMRSYQNERMQDEFRCGQSAAEVLAHDICKINARVLDPGLERELHAFLDERAETVVNTPFNPVMFEITDARTSKASAIAWLASYYGFTEDEVAVYGDGGNDIAMLERFEHAYATRNGSAAAKRAAGTVIGSCVFHAVPRHMVRTVRAERSRAAYTTIE